MVRAVLARLTSSGPVRGGLAEESSTALQSRYLPPSSTTCHKCDLGTSQNVFKPRFFLLQNRNKDESLPGLPHPVVGKSYRGGTAGPRDVGKTKVDPKSHLRLGSPQSSCVGAHATQSVGPRRAAAASASPGNLSEIQTLRPTPRPAEPESAF